MPGGLFGHVPPLFSEVHVDSSGVRIADKLSAYLCLLGFASVLFFLWSHGRLGLVRPLFLTNAVNPKRATAEGARSRSSIPDGCQTLRLLGVALGAQPINFSAAVDPLVAVVATGEALDNAILLAGACRNNLPVVF